MALRPKYLQQADPVSVTIERHMVKLGFSRSNDYIDWCWKHGFDGTLDKSKADLQDEIDAFEVDRAKRDAQNKLHRNPKAFLQSVCSGEMTSDEIERPVFKAIAKEIEESDRNREARQSLFEMLNALTAKTDLVFKSGGPNNQIPFIRGLIKLHDRRALWLRPLGDWKPKSKNQDRAFGELTHHLFDQFGDVPRFMDSVWLRNDRPSWRFRDWYVHMGRGHNLRTAKTIIPLTKKMAHHFRSAPDGYSAEQGLRWAQLQALGTSESAIHSLVATRLGRSFENEDFWFTVLRFISDNPMLDPRQIGPIVDYLHAQRYEPTEVEIEPGLWETEPPPQPNLSMSGRTVNTLLRQVDAWHRSLGKYRNLPSENYEKADFSGFAVDRSSSGDSKRWVIRQLMNARDLQIESDELRHCVASYHWSCAKGACTIWNLSVSGESQPPERRQTIEVDKNGTIVQCRGLANRDPTNEEWSIVSAWASDAGLSVAGYL